MLTKTITTSTHNTPSQGQERLNLTITMTALTNATALACILLKCFSL